MDVYIPLGIFLTLFCFLYRRNDKKATIAFSISMIIAFLFAAIRYEFGPDYTSYWNMYNGIKGSDIARYTGYGSSAEKWFLYYIEWFPSYTAFIVTNSFIWFLANYLFLSKYVQGKDSWIVILYLFFSTSYFLPSMVAMRSAMSSFIFLFAIMILIQGGKYARLIYICLILLAAQFHTTSLILLLFVFLTFNNKSVLFSPWVIGIAGLVALASFFLGKNYLLASLAEFVFDSSETLSSQYGENEDEVIGAVGSSLNTLVFIVSSVVIAFYLVLAVKKEKDSKFVFFYKIALIASLVQLMFGQSMIQERYFMFFNPCYIAALIRSNRVSNKVYNSLVFLIIAASSLYILYSKMMRPYFITFLEYNTVFNAPLIP